MQLVTEDNITELAVERWATAKDPRLAELMTALVRHLHDFAREVRLTEAEWMAAIQWLTATGQISNEKREEFILASDVLGLSMLVVQMNHRLDPRGDAGDGARPLPHRGLPGARLRRGHVRGAARARRCTSTARCATSTATRCAGAVLDVWQADTEGALRVAASPTSTRRGCGRSTRPARTAATACARSRRSATRSRWTARSATSSRRTDDQPLPPRAHPLPDQRARATSR